MLEHYMIHKKPGGKENTLMDITSVQDLNYQGKHVPVTIALIITDGHNKLTLHCDVFILLWRVNFFVTGFL